ncbi:MAG: hypothetical protein UV58_C0005G0016 [Candidatus Wolfebacteria bacterium GW2011_GWC1_43_10]|uniref:Uncharacterized protein n=2 Tax=Candidatus Wolfeibacteriota TaxID=1752735 RepID=A0A0G1CB43_9BACT|nr:MAG: hypothetical protein UV58_C0005G0016 [Candidatus Wolfebacteria bacterium GW2011_GWC1_43_10]KKT23150.1 MAG: hypothetical protein UW08_C0001G0113 [Parcubacteria group bacterium GW2011_GWB1_43_8b]
MNYAIIYKMSFKKIKILILVIGTMAVFWTVNLALAAEPLLLFSWKAQNFVPDWFGGKSLPINQTKILMSFEAVSQSQADLGKIMDVSEKEISWYVNDKTVGKGKGLKSVTVTKDDFPRDSIDVKIKGEFYDADAKESYFVNKYFTVPISEPEIVLSYKKTENYFSLNETARFDLFPFFFNVASDFLDIGWRVNEREINPLLRENLFLDLKVSDMPPTGQVRISASAKNARDVLEDASKSLIFKVY